VAGTATGSGADAWGAGGLVRTGASSNLGGAICGRTGVEIGGSGNRGRATVRVGVRVFGSANFGVRAGAASAGAAKGVCRSRPVCMAISGATSSSKPSPAA